MRSNLSLILRRLTLLATSACVISACGDDAVSYSSPVGINLKAKGDEVPGGVITDEKNINTESGNPYAQFISRARSALDGRAPTRIEVESATLSLGGNSKGVTALDQVFTGRTDVLFVVNDTNNSFAVAHTDVLTGSGPRALTVIFDDDAVGSQDWKKLVDGGFSVVLRGPAAAGFTGNKELEAELLVTFRFAAFP